MVYFDFDGTLADVWLRFYRIFTDASGIDGIAFEDYVRTKKQYPRDGDAATCFGATLPEDYWSKKRSMLEDPAYLALDRLLVPAEELCDFFRQFDCRILTNRRNPQAFRAQLTALGLGSLIERSIVLNPDEKVTKAQYLRQAHPDGQPVLVGDAEAESQAAQNGFVKVYLVRTGLRAPEEMPFADQCEIIDRVSDFMKAFKESL
jgi:phosphoglycolate phosphatase-like HAD superfamily hydrolase